MTTTSAPDRVDAATVARWIREPGAVTVLDVRSPGEFAATHVAGSRNVPLDLLGRHAARFADRLASSRVVLVCASGARATEARYHLAAAGAEDLHVLDGGVPAFAAAGGEVVHGQGRWAVERQVRLVAGSLVLTSIVASLAAPRARFLAGAIGAGLTFSALSDTCAMARVLGRLPYNRGTAAPTLDETLAQLPPAGGNRP